MTTSKEKKMAVTVISDTEISFTRIFHAPRELVFDAFTKKEHLEQWWGPRRYKTLVDKLELKQGGKWRFINRGSDGTEHAFHGEFLEFVRPEKISWTFEYEGMPGHVIIDTVTFEDLGGRTKITTLSKFSSIQDRDGMLSSGMEDGANESYERLDELLDSLQRK